MGLECTYTFLFESLYNGKCSRVVDILHDNPVNCFLVLLVDSGCFNELGLDAGYRLWVLVGIEVNGQSVNHFEDDSLSRLCGVIDEI